jgi:hypothetical protein
MITKTSIFYLFLCILNASFASPAKHAKHIKKINKESTKPVSVVNNEVLDVEFVYHCYDDDKCTKITEFTIVTPLTITCHQKLLEIKFDIYDANFTKKIEKKGYLSQNPLELISDQQSTAFECQTIKRYRTFSS